MRGLYTRAHHASYSGGLDRKLDTVFSHQLLTGDQVRTCEAWIKEASGPGVGVALQCDIRALTVVVWIGQTDCTEPREKATMGDPQRGIGPGV